MKKNKYITRDFRERKENNGRYLMQMKRWYVVIAILLPIMASGCGQVKEEVSEELLPTPTPVMSAPKEPENVMMVTDGQGYDPDERKIFYVRGSVSTQTFRISDTKTKDTVFVGGLKKIEDEHAQDDLYIGEFSSLTLEGRYTITIEDTKASSDIVIAWGLSEERRAQIVEELERIPADDRVTAYYRLAVMLLAAETYSDDYVDWAYINKEMKEALSSEEDDPESGDVNEANVSDRLVASAVLAYYYSVYGDIEPQDLDEYLDASVRLYDAAMKEADSADPVAMYLASASLNRALGQSRYRKAAESFDRDAPYNGSYGDFLFIADMLFLGSRNIGDRERCRQIIEGYLEDAASVSGIAGDPSRALGGIYQPEKDELTDRIMVCAFADSVLSSDEYRQIERDFIHYLNGLNPEAENIPGENGSDIKMLTKLIYIMGDTTSNKGKER